MWEEWEGWEWWDEWDRCDSWDRWAEWCHILKILIFHNQQLIKIFDTPDSKVSINSEINKQKKLNEIHKVDYPPIEVAEIKGQKIAIDGNSRLTIAKKAKLFLIRINITTDSEHLNELQKRLKKMD